MRPFVLPFAILLGFLFHRTLVSLNYLTPYLIFLILFLTLCDMDIRQIRISRLHICLLLFQLITGIGCYFLFLPFNDILAQGAMMGMLAPVAVSATVVAVILGADMATMVTYTILYNVFLAFFAPFCFSLIGYHTGLSFWASCWIIIRKVVPLIILPLVSAVLCRRFLPRITAKIVNHKMISFYLWAAALTFVIGQTIDFIMMQDRSKTPIIIVMVAISLVQCIVQFAFGRWIGKKYDDTIAGGQAIGQKNGVLAAWMTQMYLNPLASVVPASYVLWQNLWNSWQLWRFKSPGPVNKRVPMPNEEEKHSN